LTRAVVDGKAVIRFVICSRKTSKDDVKFAVEEIRRAAEEVILE